MSPRKTSATDDRSPTERAYMAQREAYDAWVKMLEQFPIRSNPSAWIEKAFDAGWAAHAKQAADSVREAQDFRDARPFCED